MRGMARAERAGGERSPVHDVRQRRRGIPGDVRRCLGWHHRRLRCGGRSGRCEPWRVAGRQLPASPAGALGARSCALGACLLAAANPPAWAQPATPEPAASAAVQSVDAGLIAGRHGIREPAADVSAVPPGEIDLVLVPGLAFDEAGRRLGRGAGYYDRFLAPLSVATVGVAFELQLVPEVPAGSGDVPVGAIVTERRFIRVV